MVEPDGGGCETREEIEEILAAPRVVHACALAPLEVEDNGPGIPEDLNNKVFQDFFSSKGTEGTGIGLLVVQKVAEEHGGRVTFESIPGEKTTFTVVIPHADLEDPLKSAVHPAKALEA